MPADYRYDTEDDCFVIEDEIGNEICRTKAPHVSMDKSVAVFLVTSINCGTLIFPSPSDQQPQTHA